MKCRLFTFKGSLFLYIFDIWNNYFELHRTWILIKEGILDVLHFHLLVYS